MIVSVCFLVALFGSTAAYPAAHPAAHPVRGDEGLREVYDGQSSHVWTEVLRSKRGIIRSNDEEDDVNKRVPISQTHASRQEGEKVGNDETERNGPRRPHLNGPSHVEKSQREQESRS